MAYPQYAVVEVSPLFGNKYPIPMGTKVQVIKTFRKNGEMHHRLNNRWEIPVVYFSAIKPKGVRT